MLFFQYLSAKIQTYSDSCKCFAFFFKIRRAYQKKVAALTSRHFLTIQINFNSPQNNCVKMGQNALPLWEGRNSITSK